ncbi:uncharacterized protein V1477_004113 [Vespula maculifrons]|uniref:Uncharacterized protein n=1 Tax=Vespula maculifrons TaxID=7453 RepID=A0ABD2CQZ4_VESMC
MKRCGGDALPLGGDIRRPPLTVGPNETEWWGYSATRRGYKAAAFDSGSSHATNFYHSYMNLRGTHAPQGKEKRMKRCGGDALPLGGDIRRPPLTVGPVMPRIFTIQISILANETEWWGYSATRRGYKAAAFDSGSSHATNFHHSQMNLRGTHAPQGKEKRMKRSGGDTLPLGGDIRRPPLTVSPVMLRISTIHK